MNKAKDINRNESIHFVPYKDCLSQAKEKIDMLTALDIANYFLYLGKTDEPEENGGEGICHLKLQKLVYYAQAYYLAVSGMPLFIDKVEAWPHGPVIPNLYDKFKHNGSSFIHPLDNLDLSIYPEEIKEHLNEIYSYLGQFSGWKLRNISHDETPWIDAYNSISKEITHESMKTYFKKELVS